MLSPRWRKIWADLKVDKSRTLLVVLSIVVGIFAVGSIAGTSAILNRESQALWESIDPASATLVTSGYDDTLVDQVEAMPEVEMVQRWRSFDVQAQLGPGEFQDLRLFAVPDYEGMQLSIIKPESGAWPPPEGEVLIERSATGLVNAETGQPITIQLPDGTTAELNVAGEAYDLSQPSATVLDTAYGYVTAETMTDLSGSDEYNILQFLVAENADDQAYIETVANMVRDTLESQGVIVFNLNVPTPGEPPGFVFIVALLLVLGVIGSMTFLLSGFLIVNIVSALLSQQTKQIGVMKAIGARNSQVVRMYLGLALIFGVLALLIGLPLSLFGSIGLATLIGELNNYKIEDFSAPWWVFAVQIVIGLVVPLLAALVPVFSGTRISVREALDARGINQENNSIFDRIVARFQGLPRPVMLSFRNTFRQKGRLALTVVTLTLAGAIFATVFTVRNSLFSTLDDALAYDAYDVRMDLGEAYPVEEMQPVAQSVEGVTAVEAWTDTVGRYVRPDGSQSDDIVINGLPVTSETINPLIVEGHWLEAGDTNAVVINGNIAENESSVVVGDEITVIVRGQETTWTVVGVAQAVFSFENVAWTSYDSLSAAINESGQARTLRILTEESGADYLNEKVQALTAAFGDAGLRVDGTETFAALEASFDLRFNTLVVSLLALAGLLAIVGGLGIAGATSINVIERMREIGVMRSVGAANYQILGIFIVEAVFVGLIGWVLGSIMALPISRLLSDGVGNAFSNAPLSYSFDVSGALLWLLLAVVLAFFSSYFPARRASRLTLREVLAYEG